MERLELLATAKVVGILQPSRRRSAVVGVIKEEPGAAGALFLIPCDPRLPHCLIRSSLLPPELKATLKVSDSPPIGRNLLIILDYVLSFFCKLHCLGAVPFACW